MTKTVRKGNVVICPIRGLKVYNYLYYWGYHITLFYNKYEENYKNIWILGYLIVYLHCVMVATAI